MTKGLAALSSRLVSIEQEVANLRQGYAIISARYTAALNSLKLFTVHGQIQERSARVLRVEYLRSINSRGVR